MNTHYLIEPKDAFTFGGDRLKFLPMKLPSKIILSRVDGDNQDAAGYCLLAIGEEFNRAHFAARQILTLPDYKDEIAAVTLHAHAFARFGSYGGLEDDMTDEQEAMMDTHGIVVYEDPRAISNILEAVTTDARDTMPTAEMDYVRAVFSENGFKIIGLEKHWSVEMEARYIDFEVIGLKAA